MNKISIVLVIALSLFGCKNEKNNQKLKEELFSHLNDSITNKIDSTYVMGLLKGFSVAVVDEDKILYEKGFGYRDIDTTLLYTSSTVQPVGSVSKTLIGVSLIKAVELNLLKLKDPINKYLPFKVTNPIHPNDEILIEHLAYHTSSIIDVNEIYLGVYFLESKVKGDNEGAYDFFKNPEERISLEEYLTNALDTKSNNYSKESFSSNKPGDKREYSNIASDLCALIIQNASKKNFREFTSEYILKPLGMNSSGWRFEDVEHAEQSRLFAYKDMMISKYSESSYASGQFMTSSEDLALFLRELIRGYKGNGELLSKNGYNMLFSKKKFDGNTYGHFIEFTDNWLDIKDNIIGHNGADYGVFSGMYFNPERGTGKIMISNTDTDFYDNLDVWPETKKIWESLIEYEIQAQRINASR
jgi:CubicO group peptidase (beta-lactamase class C family)